MRIHLLNTDLQDSLKPLTKIIYRKERKHVDIDFWKTKNVLGLDQLYKFENLVLAHKIKYSKDELPVVFQNHLKLNENTHLRSKDNFQLPLLNSRMAQKQSFFQMSKFWNSMPSNLKRISNLRTLIEEKRIK